MRTGSSAKVLGFCGQEAGDTVGLPAVIWGRWWHVEADAWCARVSGEANQIFAPAAGDQIRRYGWRWCGK